MTKKTKKGPSVKDLVSKDKLIARLEQDNRDFKRKYKYLLSEQEALVKQIGGIRQLEGDNSIITIDPYLPSEENEATAVILASDWHIEEKVVPESVNDLNKFNLIIAEERAKKFFSTAVRMVKVFNKDIKVNHVVLALLGDFFSNNIHPELIEVADALPMEAQRVANSYLKSGIKYMLDNLKQPMTIVCHSGNHTRTTKGYRYSTEWGLSLEWSMYEHLKETFSRYERVEFMIPKATQSYLDVYDYKIRFMHGHGVKGGFGVGGLSIPLNRAIQRWNQNTPTDLTVLGHFHQSLDGGSQRWLVNGSLIGYNAYAMSKGYAFDVPRQTMFLIDKKRGKTIVAPILCE